MATRVSWGKIWLATFDWPTLITNYRPKDPEDFFTEAEWLPSLSQISLPWQRGSVGKNVDCTVWRRNPEPPSGRKIFTDISYRSRLKAHFVPNFVAMATGVGWEKCGLQRSTAQPRTPYGRKNFAGISYRSRVIAHFVPNFVAMATRVSLQLCAALLLLITSKLSDIFCSAGSPFVNMLNMPKSASKCVCTSLHQSA